MDMRRNAVEIEAERYQLNMLRTHELDVAARVVIMMMRRDQGRNLPTRHSSLAISPPPAPSYSI
jgi:hypothetical protein